MNTFRNSLGFTRIALPTLFFLATFSAAVQGDEIQVKLSGGMEVPPVTTAATGAGTIVVGPDSAVSGSVTTTGIAGTMAHIHLAAVGKNGPVIIPLTKNGDSTWTVPAGAKLTGDQYRAFQAGELYVNVHSAANKGGEIRGQLK